MSINSKNDDICNDDMKDEKIIDSMPEGYKWETYLELNNEHAHQMPDTAKNMSIRRLNSCSK